MIRREVRDKKRIKDDEHIIRQMDLPRKCLVIAILQSGYSDHEWFISDARKVT